MKCQYCGFDTGLPFRCPFCGGIFYVEHRLPETHMCPSFRKDLRVFRGLGETTGPSLTRRVTPWLFSGFGRRIFNVARSPEIFHVCLAAVIVALVGLSTAVATLGFLNPFLISLLVLIFVISFTLHEIGHKFTAKHYGLWAEFRLSFLGVLVTLISIFTPLIKVVSPGSVVIYGWADRRIMGRISLSGPLINIVLSLIFLTLTLFNFGGILLGIAYIWGFAINAYIALFNLIPLSILDGAKIFQWNRHVWAIMFTIALIFIAAYVLLY
ncbi:MAG: AN1-type zinc finger domain-containing protein [Candidatus Bathyarchaeia archaeon]